MFFYNWREMVLWTSIFAIASVLLLLGVKEDGDSHLLRLATGPKDSFQDRLGQDIKTLIERRTPYRVVLIHGRDSQASQQMLLDKKADFAVIAPAALQGTQTWVAVAPLASVQAHLLVDANSDKTSPYQVSAGAIGFGENGSDSVALGLNLLQALGLGASQRLRLNDVAPVTKPSMLLDTDHVTAPQWQSLLETGRYRLLPLREVAAIVARQPLWTSAAIPAYVHAFPRQQLPKTDIASVATPVVVATLKESSSITATEISAVMSSSEGQALAARYGADLTTRVWNLLPKHPAIGGDALPVREQLQQELAWWLEHKTTVLLILTGLALLALQWRVIRNGRRAAATERVTRQVRKWLDQLVNMEQRARTDNDLRSLYQLQEEVNHIKLQGSKVMIGSSLIHDPLMGNFMLQCQWVMAIIENRLGGKASIATPAMTSANSVSINAASAA